MVAGLTSTVTGYLAQLPPERRKVIAEVRKLVKRHLPEGYVEAMGLGMITWQIPRSRYPDTYNKQPLAPVALAAQKNHFALYLMCAYADSTADHGLRATYAAAGKKLDMGKCCLRFTSLDGLLPDALSLLLAATTVESYIAQYEDSRGRK
jgi:uncharacterized protein YdhG (YjbR/CyaY superfamily)